ncbi:MAG: diacylglycerol kinase family lipid kinase, partial [Caldilineaceae bacterium]|nr:diacylglycerol kinase family lipid kinase [Caldilineaceae bacterium]
VTVGNSPRTGGGFYLTPDALLDDGLLDIGILDNVSRWRILGLLPKALKGAHTNDPAVVMLRTRQLTLRSQEQMPVQLDGEVVTRNADSVEIELQPGRLEVVA